VCSSDSKEPYKIEVSPSTGLDNVFVVYGQDAFSLKFLTSETDDIAVYSYKDNLSTSEKATFEIVSQGIEIVRPMSDCGYYIKSGEKNLGAIWVTCYNPNGFVLNSVSVDADNSDCEYTRLLVDRNSERLFYKSASGAVHDIRRIVEVEWSTLEWNNENTSFDIKQINETANDSKEITLESPLCETSFKIIGDQFLKYWGIVKSVESDIYNAVSVIGEAFATQTVEETDNQIKAESTDLGGSAPVKVNFTGFYNSPVTTYYAWEMSKDEDFENIDYTFTDETLDYSFTDEGLTYVRFVISNSMNSCEKVVKTFTIEVSESSLKVPNVITPGSDTGNNLLFKVAYRSIVKFEGWIYNRWGNELFHWKDPNLGWDGTYKGKPLPTGAYFYVIKAEGAGGKKYNLKGDINLLRTRNVN
jgi:hypothetical protein